VLNIVNTLIFEDLEDEGIGGEVVVAGGFEGGADAGLRIVDGARHEVDGEFGSGGGNAEGGGDFNGAGAEGAVEVVTEVRRRLEGESGLEDGEGGLALGAAREGFVGKDGVVVDVHDGLKGHGKGREVGGIPAYTAGGREPGGLCRSQHGKCIGGRRRDVSGVARCVRLDGSATMEER
jgi:hypothetical protein